MFTGLIEETGSVRSVDVSGNGVNITVSAKEILTDVKIGDSIAIDGACQTVTKFSKDSFTVFASKVTCDATTLSSFKTGRKVNLERAMSANGRFGGHFVQGHVDSTGKIKSVESDESGMKIEVTISADISRYIVEKGSITVDGISLTVVSLIENGFVLYLIPETITSTTLIEKKAGDDVNIEVDMLAKYVERMLLLDRKDDRNNEDSLKKALLEGGFI
ncbi:MAG: riboflavin synthase [Spirochaetes bacterium]|nr:riboflavin synthase [Spirochaetota bacterium]